MFSIVHINPHFVVIDKHPNVSVHKDDGDTMLVAEVAASIGDEQLYLVHRLDKMTSGLLLLARDATTAATLSGLFAARQVSKYYLAIGEKKPTKKQGLIVGDMARSRRSSWKLLSSKENPAVTQFFSLAGENGQRLFLCKPHTGKTHQIRVALKSIGSGIIGDPIYGSAAVNADRGYLHAYVLQFVFGDKQHCFTSIPTAGNAWTSASMADALQQWKQPWDLPWPVIKSGNRK
ncbi:TIGR01621 family pseudouridine synthase [Thaumasiovibrio sp. DFM-14]|uniref:TIGR01621 family pseudouridine synthase n=1 Tax=Thaumasiovibrio sp. DFM-14 TaxID=3384792 RepID=UPI0039A2C038